MWEFADHNTFMALLMVVVLACAAVSPFFFAFCAYNQTLRSRNIIARGWPPPHLDADGDFKEEEEVEDDAGCVPPRAAESPAR